MMEIHLCEKCAQEKGTEFKTHFSIGDILSGFIDLEDAATAGRKKQALVCAECGSTYEQFTKSGRLGCASCYTAFSKLLLPLIKRVQRSVQHCGKSPEIAGDKKGSSIQSLRQLREKLQKMVAGEEFEKAAQLRDEIKKIEDKKKKKDSNE